MQRAAEARALADSLTPEQSYYPQEEVYVQPSYAEPTVTIEDVGDHDEDWNPDLDSPQDSVAGDSDVSFAQGYGQSPTHRHHHHRRYNQQTVQSAYQTAYMPQQSAFAPPAPPIAPQWSASNPPPPPTGYNDGY
jgi:hypothetical protein